MVKKSILTLIVFFLICNSSIVFAATDYLKASTSEVSPSTTARVGQPIVANMKLSGFTPYPEEATLEINVEVDRPRIEVIIDGEYEVYGLPQIQIELSSEGVKDIEIRVNGFAPEVTKLTTITVLDVKTHLRYKGEDETTQEDGTLSLTVSDKEILQTVAAIDDAWDEYNRVRRAIAALSGKGINTVEVESELEDIKAQINLADDAHGKGDIDTAQLNAEIALNSIGRLDDKVTGMDSGPTPTDVKR
ncbi:MAG: hypothetical protein V3W19_06550, partial [Desulfatiglandales bacterium]